MCWSLLCVFYLSLCVNGTANLVLTSWSESKSLESVVLIGLDFCEWDSISNYCPKRFGEKAREWPFHKKIVSKDKQRKYMPESTLIKLEANGINQIWQLSKHKCLKIQGPNVVIQVAPSSHLSILTSVVWGSCIVYYLKCASINLHPLVRRLCHQQTQACSWRAAPLSWHEAMFCNCLLWEADRQGRLWDHQNDDEEGIIIWSLIFSVENFFVHIVCPFCPETNLSLLQSC